MPEFDVPVIPSSDIPVECKDLTVLPLEEVAQILERDLKKNFHEATVSVVDCPDLTEKPFGLVAKGLCGQTRILDVGGVPYLIPTVKLDKLYDMKEFPAITDFRFEDSEMNSALLIGAGAAPWTALNRNAEMMLNMRVGSDSQVLEQRTQISRTFDEDGSTKLFPFPENESKMSLLCNIFMSEGKSGKVLEVRAKKRIGDENFVTCMRKALEVANPGSIALGGVFCATSGRLKIHVMPKFSDTPLNTNDDVNNWLKFYEMDAPFTNFSVFISRDPDLDLRIEHTHGHNIDCCQGGHYHCDTTPEDVEYIGYFNIAEKCFRLDKPVDTNQILRE